MWPAPRVLRRDQDLFTTRMRRETRAIHSVSDTLVNAKFAISLSDQKVWSAGLFVFYHIFAYLEEAKERLKMIDFDRLFVHRILYRKKAFEEDLVHYLGDTWRTEERPEAVLNYLRHLEQLEKTQPRLLLAYVYHLYLGLLSGGQVLASKRRLFGDLRHTAYYKDHVTDFTGANISNLKCDLRDEMNKIAAKMTRAEQEEFINESNHVFMLNNQIVESISGQLEVLKMFILKMTLVGMLITGLIFAYKMFKRI